MNNIKLPDTAHDMAFSTLIGVLVSVCGNALISVALNVQKRAHNNIQRKHHYLDGIDEQPSWTYNGFLPDDGYSSPRESLDVHPYSNEQTNHEQQQQKFKLTLEHQDQNLSDTEFLKSKLWWLGILLMVLGEIGNFVAYGFAPASTIAPLGTTTLVANVIIAPLMLKEIFRKRDLLGVILAVSGAAIVVLSSNSEELSPELIMEAITQTRSIVYFILTAISIIILTIISPVYGSTSIFIDLGLVAVYGGYTVLSTKSVASLMSLTLWKMFTHPVSYILISVLVFTAILQIKYLNKALQRFDSTEVIPTQFVLFTVSAIVGSAVLYHDFDDMTVDQLLRFMFGCAIEFLGVYLITSKRNKFNDDSFKHAGNGVGISLYDNTNEAISHVDIISDDQSSILSASSQPYINNYKSVSKQSSAQFLNASATTIQPHLRNSSSFEIWRENPDNSTKYYMLGNSNSTSTVGHRRNSSSIFRGISMASQLVDRNEEPPTVTPAIQLPISASPSPNVSGSHLNATRKLNDSAFSNFVQSFTSTLSSSPSKNLDVHHGNTDVVKITIPTVSAPSIAPSTNQHQNSSSTFQNDSIFDRELMPLDNQKITTHHNSNSSKLPISRKLIDIEEDLLENVDE